MGRRTAASEEITVAPEPGDDLFDWTDGFFDNVSLDDIDASAAVGRHLESLTNPISKVFLKMTSASFYIPKDNPKQPRGEDAHFISTEKQTIGVADGVGGWIKVGIDGGEYARQIMINSVLSLNNQPKGGVNPKRVLQEAYKNTTAQGSSTACIITLSGDRLCAANVGDSGFLVIRHDNVIYQSPTQQRRFNCPYQLGNTRDNPSIAMEIECHEMVEIVRRDRMEGKDLMEQGCYMANLALYNSFDKYAETPYSIASRRAGRCHRGGKVDDITVIIVRIDEV
ncbi:hypothetical protein Pfo_028376 [Paulownia fortunei]|nr:hypothetical protein Pfo_028376 [Paulownia fortunei]